MGNAIASLCVVIPGGVVVFFASYSYLETVTSRWKSVGIVERIEKKKKVYRILNPSKIKKFMTTTDIR